MNVGELKLSFFLDVRPLSESIKTGLNLLKMFNTSSKDILSLKPPTFKSGDFDAQINKLNTKLDQFQNEASEASRSADIFNKSLSRTSTTSVTLNDTMQNLFLRFQGIQSTIQILSGTLGDYLNKFNSFQSALLGLESISVFKGIDKSKTAETVQNLELVKNGLLSVADASTSFKNLLSANFTLEQSTEIIKRLGESAAFGRQESLSFGDAVRSATEGIKNGNSILVDNAGVTKNLSIMLEEAGFKAQDLSKAGQDAGIRMAIFNGILNETTGQLGNADKLINSSQGALIRYEKSINDLKIAFGGIISIGAQFATTILKPFNEFLISAPPRVKVAALAVSSLVVVFTLLNGQLSLTTKGFLLINTLIIALPTPVKILIGGLALVAAGILAVNTQLTIMNVELAGIPMLIGLVVTAATAFGSAFGDIQSSAVDVNSVLEESSKQSKEYADNIAALTTVSEAHKNGLVLTQSQQEQYNLALDKVKSIYPEVITGIDAKSKSEKVNSGILEDLIKQEQEKSKIYLDAKMEVVAGEVKDLAELYVEQTDTIEELNNKLSDLNQLTKQYGELPSILKSEVREVSQELISTTKATEETKQKLVEIFSLSLKNNSLTEAIIKFSNELDDSKDAADLLSSAISSMANNIIERLKSVGRAGKEMNQLLSLVALSQNLLQMSLDTSLPDAIRQAYANRAQEYLNAINNALSQLQSIPTNSPPTTDNKGLDTKVEKEKESLNVLQEYNKKLEETKKQIEEINALLKDTNLRPDEIQLLIENKNRLERELERYKIDSEPSTVNKNPEIKTFEEQKHKMKSLAEAFAENLMKGIDDGINIAYQIQGILQAGSHTLVGKFIAALQVTQQIVALLQSLQLAQGLFGFLGKIFGFALAPVTGGASAAMSLGGMPSGAGGNLGRLTEMYSNAINYIRSNSGVQTAHVPYFVSLKADGRKLRAVIQQVDKIDNARLK